MKASEELVEVAWHYVILHNKEFPLDPRFVDTREGQPLINTEPSCQQIAPGFYAHIGHGVGEPCKLRREARKNDPSPAVPEKVEA